jgi:effector-binding domain-containing protein
MTVERAERQPRAIVGLREFVPMRALSEFFGRAFGAAAGELARQGGAPAGPPVALYRGPVTDTVDVTAGFPVRHPVAPAATGVVAATLPGGSTVEAARVGPYDLLPATYAEVTGWLADHGLSAGEEMWEEYVVGPGSEAGSARWQTRIVFPVS